MSKLNEAQPVAPVVVVVPPLLADAIEQLVVSWSRAFGADDRRSVEVAILQRGIRAVQAELREALEFGERNGWSKEEAADVF